MQSCQQRQQGDFNETQFIATMTITKSTSSFSKRRIDSAMPPSATSINTAIRARKDFSETVTSRGRQTRDGVGSEEKFFHVFCSPQVTDMFEDIRDSCIDSKSCCDTFKTVISIFSKQRLPTLYSVNCPDKMADTCTTKSIVTDSAVYTQRIRFVGDGNNKTLSTNTTSTSRPSKQPRRRSHHSPPPATGPSNIYLVPLGRPESFETIDDNDDHSTPEEGRDDDHCTSEASAPAGVDAIDDGYHKFSSARNSIGGLATVDDLIMTVVEKGDISVKSGSAHDENDLCLRLSKDSWDGELNAQCDKNNGPSPSIDVDLVAEEQYDDMPCRQE